MQSSQRIARRDKKAFFSDQCKRNRGKKQNGKDQRSLEEIRDTKDWGQEEKGTTEDKMAG